MLKDGFKIIMTCTYKVIVETDGENVNEDAHVKIQKEIESFLDENSVHNNISKISKESGVTGGKVTIMIFV